MQITLNLCFPAISPSTKCISATKTWRDITSDECPFWREIHKNVPVEAHFGFPQYPHTGDTHTHFFVKSDYRVKFIAKTETSPGITITGSVISVSSKGSSTIALQLSEDEIWKMLEKDGWTLI